MGQAKRNQQRHCPALGEIITPAVCATNRNSDIVCPQDCPHNPFNPEHYLGIYQPLEAQVVKNLSLMLYQDPSFTKMAQIKKAVFSKDDFPANALHVWHIHGEDRVAKWREAGALRGWKNDEIVMAEALDTIRGAVLEVQGILDDRTTLVRDLLRPDEPPFTLVDVTTAANACRFDVYLTWVYAIPGGLYRLSGVAQVVEDFGTMSYPEVFSILFKHLGAPETAREKWILEYMIPISQALAATQRARSVRQFEMSDLVICERICQFGKKGEKQGPAEVRSLAQKILADPRVCDDGLGNPGPLLRATLLTKISSDEGPVETVGSITVFPDGAVHLSCMGMEKSASLLDFIRSIEPSMWVADESLKDLGKERMEQLPEWDRSLVPAALLENISKIAMQSSRIPAGGAKNPMKASLVSSFENFVDIPVPALDDRTPRDAAGNPALRPRLVELMKRQVHMVDKQRRTNGVDFDLNPLLEGLGLTEIIHRPAPCGIREETEDDEEEDEVEFFEMPPPQLPIQGAELDRRLKAAMESDLHTLANCGPLRELLDAIPELHSELTEAEIDALRFAVSMAHGILHSRPPEDYNPDPDQMIDRFDDFVGEYMSLDTQQDYEEFIDRITDATRQKPVVILAAETFESRQKSKIKRERIREEMMPLMLIAFCAALSEITLWPPSRL